MNINRMTLPYPILGVKDDILPPPSLTDVEAEQSRDKYIFKFSVLLNNEKIENLIKCDLANYVCEVECPKTFFRKGYIQHSPYFSITIPKSQLSGSITFEVTVTVTKQISQYENPGFHEDYKGYKFSLGAGDLLAYVKQFSYDADIRYDKLQAVGTFMEIKEGPVDSTTSVELGHDKIRILLPKSMFDFYRTNFGRNRHVSSVIHASLVFNALIEALYNAREYKGMLWCRTILYRLKTESNLMRYYTDDEDLFLDEDVFNIAQQLLGDPYKRMFVCLNELSNSDTTIDD